MTPTENFAQKRLEAEALIRQHAPLRLQEQIIALLFPVIALETTLADDRQIPIGASKFGGAPDVPENFEWPHHNEVEPLIFLAQIDLKEIEPFDVHDVLPSKGTLSFFYGIQEGPCEQIYNVYWFEDAVLQRFSSPPSSADFKTCRVDFSTRIELGSLYDYLEWEDFQETIAYPLPPIGNQSPEPGIKMLGLPNYGFIDRPKSDLVDFRLLLQVDSVHKLDMCWCDAGTLFFLIHKSDLMNRDFSKVYANIDAG